LLNDVPSGINTKYHLIVCGISDSNTSDSGSKHLTSTNNVETSKYTYIKWSSNREQPNLLLRALSDFCTSIQTKWRIVKIVCKAG